MGKKKKKGKKKDIDITQYDAPQSTGYVSPWLNWFNIIEPTETLFMRYLRSAFPPPIQEVRVPLMEDDAAKAADEFQRIVDDLNQKEQP